jgi:putative membrane protein
MIRRTCPSVVGGASAGFVAMALLALAQSRGLGAAGGHHAGWLLMFVAGVAGASAMILPGISGGYLLLVLGVYVPILGGIDAVKQALKATDVQALMEPGLNIVLPVGLGVVIGVVAVSNLLKLLLHRYERATLGVLLGLLLGAVVGLWPFQQTVTPKPGDVIKGRVVTEQTLAELEEEDYPTAYFTPTAAQVGGALGLIGAGFLATLLIGRLGAGRPNGQG